MTASSYVTGLLVLVGVIVPLALASRVIVRRVVPEWVGALARLAHVVVFLALLFAVAQLVGTFGWLRRVPLVVVAVTVGGAAVAAERVWRGGTEHRGSESAPRSTDDRAASWRPWIIAGAVALGALPWLAGVVRSVQNGVGGLDSLTYHMPMAARYAQTGRATTIWYVLPGSDTPFYPGDSELLHAIGMVAFGRDVISPFLNLFWFAMAALAAWCAGIGRRVSMLTLLGGLALLTCPLMIATNAGRAVNDIAVVALLLAAVAFLLNGEGRRGPIWLAAIASGMAVSTKLSAVALVVILTVALLVAAGRGRRISAAAIWLPSLALTGGYWYIRNLIVTGSPLPTTHLGIGPIAFPSAHLVRPFSSASVSKYLTNTEVWRAAFLPGLKSSFGVTWPAMLALVLVGAVLAIVRGTGLVRVVGAVSLLAVGAYLVTPLSAAGTAASPGLFFGRNLRYVYPPAAVALVVLPVVLVEVRNRLKPVLIALLTIVLISDTYYVIIDLTLAVVAVAVVIALVAVGVVWYVSVTQGSPHRHSFIAALAAFVVLVSLAAGWMGQRYYFHHRYATKETPFASASPLDIGLVYSFGTKTSHSRVAIAGIAYPYPLFGQTLTNDVEFPGQVGDHGAFDAAPSCREWRMLLNRGHYAFVVIAADQLGFVPPETEWTQSDPAVSVVRRAGSAIVLRVTGRFDPSAC